MKRTVKVLGLVLAAVLAFSAVAASGASAFQLKSSNGTYPQTLTGSQTGSGDVFTTNAGTVTCTTATYSGTLSAASSEPEVTPSYSGCTAFGFINVPIDVNGCKYRFHATTETSAGHFSGTTDIVCSGTNKITVTAPGCTVTIGSQNGLGSVTYQNTSTTPASVDITVSISSAIEYTVDTGCSTTKAGTFTNGSYSGHANADSTGGIFIG